MIAAFALILLAQATASCALPGSDRLGGDAMVVRPIGTFEVTPFQRLGPATDIRGEGGKIHEAQSTAKASPDSDRPAAQCEAVAAPIV